MKKKWVILCNVCEGDWNLLHLFKKESEAWKNWEFYCKVFIWKLAFSFYIFRLIDWLHKTASFPLWPFYRVTFMFYNSLLFLIYIYIYISNFDFILLISFLIVIFRCTWGWCYFILFFIERLINL